MTLQQIEKEVGKAKKLARRQIYRYMAELTISPLGSARPRNYPEDAAARIIMRLGAPPQRILSPAELRRERERSQRRAA